MLVHRISFLFAPNHVSQISEKYFRTYFRHDINISDAAPTYRLSTGCSFSSALSERTKNNLAIVVHFLSINFNFMKGSDGKISKHVVSSAVLNIFCELIRCVELSEDG